MALIRADVVDFWRLLARFLENSKTPLAAHFLLYPNPYPKAKHIQRRFYAHAVFPVLAALGGRFECRTNWEIYAREMAQTLKILGEQAAVLGGQGAAAEPSAEPFAEPFFPENPITAFERKYLKSAHTLWRVRCDFSKK